MGNTRLALAAQRAFDIIAKYAHVFRQFAIVVGHCDLRLEEVSSKSAHRQTIQQLARFPAEDEKRDTPTGKI
jgi:hypothetical protein